MPPKKTSNTVHLVLVRQSDGSIDRIVDAYTNKDDAIAATDDVSDSEVLAVEVKSAAAKPKAKAAKSEESTTKKSSKSSAKKAKTEDDDDDEEVENAKVVAKKSAGDDKRKHVLEGEEGSLDGMKLMFTGTFEMDRKTCEATAKKYGATIVGVLKKADLIILGTKPGPNKVQEIEENDYKTTDEAGFKAMIAKKQKGSA